MAFRILGLFFCVCLLVCGAWAVTTEVHLVKLAADGKTVIAERTVDYRWLESNLQVYGDGSTHYYHQGPTFDDTDLWDPTESKNVQDKDMGAVKGTAVRDLCGLVGGMQSGDTLVVRSGDGFSKKFSYRTVYTPSARQGPMVLTWYKANEGYVPGYSTGMRIVFYADTSTNPFGLHVFGNSDMKASMPQNEWHFFNGVYPTTTGLSVQSVSDIQILSSHPASTTAPPTTRPTVTPSPIQKVTPTVTQVPSGTGTKTPVPSATPAPSWTVPRPSGTTLPVVTGTTVPTTTVTTGGVVTTPAVTTGMTTVVPSSGGSDIEPKRSPGATTSTPAGTSSTTSSPSSGVTKPPSISPAPSVTVPNLTPGTTGNGTIEPSTIPPATSPINYSGSTDWSYSGSVDYTTSASGDATTTITAMATPTPEPTSTTAEPLVTTTPVHPTATAISAGVPVLAPTIIETQVNRSYNRTVTRSLGFTFSFTVRESGDGMPFIDPRHSRGAVISPYSPLGAFWAAIKAFVAMIDPFFI